MLVTVTFCTTADALAAMRFLVFGHAILERALAPYKGVTAKALVIDVAAEAVALPPAALADVLDAKAKEFDNVVKIGRTHLQDATPIRLGQELSGYAAQARLGATRVEKAIRALRELPLGGTAVGTGINSAGAASVIRLDSSKITGNGTGIATAGGGVIRSFGNNVIEGNGIDGTPTQNASLK